MKSMRELMNEKIKNDYQGKRISIVFNSLPEIEKWSHSGLDYCTKIFFSNFIHFLAKRSATLQVTNDPECVAHVITKEAWKKCKDKHGKFNKLCLEELLDCDVIIALGCNAETREMINASRIPCIVIQTSCEEVFPHNSKVITETPNFAISDIIKELNQMWQVRL